MLLHWSRISCGIAYLSDLRWHDWIADGYSGEGEVDFDCDVVRDEALENFIDVHLATISLVQFSTSLQEGVRWDKQGNRLEQRWTNTYAHALAERFRALGYEVTTSPSVVNRNTGNNIKVWTVNLTKRKK